MHTDVSPVLAQTFTEPFTVFSAKRFPGVPGKIPSNSPHAGSHPYVYPYRYDCSFNSARKPGSEAAAGKFAPPYLNGAAISSLSYPSQRNRNSTKGRKRQRHGSDESGEESDDG